ncbi:hypothetical protein LCGC14_2302310 [marine sediment metagenome]|uniref:Right handed beta helix domain-containing protein n=1 Tax=marine sediment metagenome TaxID=412755 RepID=A0A0F9DAN3_9ZZZZ
MPQQVNVGRSLNFAPGAIVTGSWNGSFDTGGTTYYVNNITGNDTADGKSWNSAVAQPEQAIALSEASRLIHVGTTTNDYIRNTIVVQGTGTAYTAVTEIPNYVNLIGLGADPRGNGTGIAKIDGAGAADAMSVDSNGCRGLFMANLQFNNSGAASVYGADFAKLFRSRIEACVFSNSGYGGLRIVLGGGVSIIDCDSTNDTLAQLIGLTLGASATVNALKVVGSHWFGDTNGVSFIATAGKQTVFKDCAAIGGTYGWIDTTPSDVGHMPIYIDCYGFGTNNTTINQTGFVLSNNYLKRAFRCIDNANGTSLNYPSTAD